MKLEDRAAFLIEATFSTAAEALDRAGQELADFMEEMDRNRTEKESEEPADSGSNDTQRASTDSNHD